MRSALQVAEHLSGCEDRWLREAVGHHAFGWPTSHMAGVVPQKIVVDELFRAEGVGRCSGVALCDGA